ncbi:MAG: CHAT domain-containing protein [Oscillatoria princeps RMCB-10]|nr:CHAT domain-containing protein [Oscillatoria princeps RMCB-10]
MGTINNFLGEKQKALEFYNQALPLIRAVGDREGEATTLNNIGGVYNSLGEKQQALEFLNQALPLLRAVGDRGGEATTLNNIAYLQRNQGNLTEALTDIEAAIAIIEDLRTKIGSQELRQSYFATVQNYYQFYIDLLMQLHQQNPSQGYDAKALHASERSRARSLLELLTEAGQTGLGKEVSGEGLVGLTRGFMYAGARRVVVSLWSVNDVATSEVMAKFYQKLLNQGKNPILALREAQLEMFNSGQWKSPYYWAAFTVQGDWR